MKISKALLIRRTDREDGWIPGISIPVCDSCDTYQKAFDEIKDILSSDSFVEKLIETFYLKDIFDEYNKQDFKFSSAGFSYGVIIYTFYNSEGEVLCTGFSLDYISTVIL